MIVSELALRNWTKLPARERIITDLTMLGLEVDDVAPVAGEFNNVVVGEVVECKQHPNADKLRVTKVNVGEAELLDIVCGAPNCRQGLKVCVAKVGAVLPGDFKIKPAELRGEASNGMLCSYSELGIAIEANGIIELPADAPVGTDVRDYLQLDDVVVEIGLTANRADCLSQLGVARDLAAKYQLPTKFADFKQELFAQASARVTIDEIFPVELVDDQACPAYASRVINGVNVNAKTPEWMVQYLARVGVRSIDPIVDITNFVLHDLGHPLHAFDKANLHEKIIVRAAQEGEKIVLLSGETAELKSNTLVIADAQGPVALAGIFGGEHSGVNAQTQDIVLEAAHFAPLAIVNRARQYGLHTDASHRYERGVDPQMLLVAMERATQLVLEICGGNAGPVNLLGQIPDNTKRITLTHTLLEQIAGIGYSRQQVIDILTGLGCYVTANDDHTYTVVTPSWRFDLEIPEDLVEEIIRIHGYENIPTEAPVAKLAMRQFHEADLALNRVKDVLVNRDFQEVVTYSFVEPKLQALFHPNEPTLDLPNPISVEMSQMRLSLFTNLYSTLAYNLKRQQKRVRIFETGLTFVPNPQAELGVSQELVLAGLVAGETTPESWNHKAQAVDFFHVKGIVEDLLAITNASELGEVRFAPAQVAGFHPGQTAEILINGEKVGLVGKVHPALAKPYGVSGDAYMFALEAKAISQTHVPQVQPVSKFPSNKRDIALIVKDDVLVGDLVAAARKAGSELLTDVQLFDLFTGAPLEQGTKSVALTLTITASDRTLEDAETNAEMTRVVSALTAEFGAVLREV
ncbi:phenylalanine--tRNA ligase subunit beta [Psittacicella gerlachiana]|uniref:Phenylalanine--tRNA ligase beta subunit n=1 Tax=Psittacicella gerlachiana TaxID=2028574 RepID=A0A3A1Y7L5_9GAMM|nr:phenylalanine--tRNA ligase subunit beta [Psittacicella gerlachiana]RIY34283.1 phenylalanine--tRNA ligase subunit beta [Psittacicella gerlachiana]